MRSLIAFASLTLFAAAAAQAGGDYSHHRKMESVDADGDGVITREEASSHPRLAEKFDTVDANKDGRLDKDELAAQRDAHHAEMKARVEERWKAADTNGDGAIDLAEAQTGMPKLAEKFTTVDADNDGKVTPEELKALRHR
jgi:Ca2+-binding EF-hand superfamily protein